MNQSLFQVMLPDDCKLYHNRIDIWQFNLAKLPASAETILNKDELQRAKRFYFEHHQQRFITARVIMRIILGRYLQNDPAKISFSYNRYGKPEINKANLQFNISHSQDLALLAVGCNYPLGIDLEYFSKRPYAGISQLVFSEQELKRLSTLPASFKPLAFFNLWAQKEAFIKACGQGLSYPLKKISLPLFAAKENDLYDPVNQQAWKITSFMPAVLCSAALCYAPAIDIIRKITIDANQFLPEKI